MALLLWKAASPPVINQHCSIATKECVAVGSPDLLQRSGRTPGLQAAVRLSPLVLLPPLSPLTPHHCTSPCTLRPVQPAPAAQNSNQSQFSVRSQAAAQSLADFCAAVEARAPRWGAGAFRLGRSPHARQAGAPMPHRTPAEARDQHPHGALGPEAGVQRGPLALPLGRRLVHIGNAVVLLGGTQGKKGQAEQHQRPGDADEGTPAWRSLLVPAPQPPHGGLGGVIGRNSVYPHISGRLMNGFQAWIMPGVPFAWPLAPCAQPPIRALRWQGSKSPWASCPPAPILPCQGPACNASNAWDLAKNASISTCSCESCSPDPQLLQGSNGYCGADDLTACTALCGLGPGPLPWMHLGDRAARAGTSYRACHRQTGDWISRSAAPVHARDRCRVAGMEVGAMPTRAIHTPPPPQQGLWTSMGLCGSKASVLTREHTPHRLPSSSSV